MGAVCFLAVWVLFAGGFAGAQEPQAPAGGARAAGAATSDPALIPGQAAPVAQKCKKRRQERVDVNVLVNSSGVPVQYYLRSAHGDEADLIALRTVGNDRFVPARRGGEPVQVERGVAVEMDLCAEKQKASDGTKFEQLVLASTPVQRIFAVDEAGRGASAEMENTGVDSGRPYRVGAGVSAPKPLLTPEAHYSNQARKARLQGTCLIQAIVDPHGIPENPRIVRPLGYGLDEEALAAVRSYRFQPAMKNGQLAVAATITIEVNFRLY